MRMDRKQQEEGQARLKALRSDLGRFQRGLELLQRNQLLHDEDREQGFETGADPSQGLLSLERTHRMALEAEQIGANVLSDLRRQREQLTHAARTLRDTDQDLDTSNRILREMLRRMRTNKVITIGVIALLVLAILLVLYVKIFR